MHVLLATLAVGCTFSSEDTTEDTDTEPVEDGVCGDPHAEWWCFHCYDDRGPIIPDTGNAACPPPSAEGAEPCGDYEVVKSGGGVGGLNHYFRDGEHVSTEYYTDFAVYCAAEREVPSTQYWYGPEVECP
jgi:hypothetical protein